MRMKKVTIVLLLIVAKITAFFIFGRLFNIQRFLSVVTIWQSEPQITIRHKPDHIMIKQNKYAPLATIESHGVKQMKVITGVESVKTTSENETKQIFWYGDFFGSPHPLVKEPQDFLNFCPEVQCTVTSKPELYKKSDAVLFHLPDINRYKAPQKLPNQAWILMSHESPQSYPGKIADDFRDKFNWTASYMHSSDIYMPYFSYGKIPDNEIKQNNLPNYFSKKERKILWFVSNCVTKSKRMLITKELKKLGWTIDIFGACGVASPCGKGSECEKKQVDKYMFYLSFENSLCLDYATEKPGKALAMNIVPIVYGYSNYSKFIPPKSFIDVSDFSSIKALSDHLNKVASSRDLYNSYFKWKEQYRVVYKSWPCDICRLLHNGYHRHYSDINDWWNVDKLCKQPNIVLQ